MDEGWKSSTQNVFPGRRFCAGSHQPKEVLCENLLGGRIILYWSICLIMMLPNVAAESPVHCVCVSDVCLCCVLEATANKHESGITAATQSEAGLSQHVYLYKRILHVSPVDGYAFSLFHTSTQSRARATCFHREQLLLQLSVGAKIRLESLQTII